MTLGFMQHFPKGIKVLEGQPTHFLEKIWEAILQKGIEVNALEFSDLGRKVLPKNYKVGTHAPKLHTMRMDEKNLWKAGNDIHFVINNRTPQRFQFAPVVKCVSTQEVEIKYQNISFQNKGVNPIKTVSVTIDGKTEWGFHDMVKKLAINDGFESVEDFFSYFNTDWKGTLIHWTDLKY
tara:strand:- start:30523 stop:31059 length:537 start_codon:yes stop_codon:yes gene_type:complete